MSKGLFEVAARNKLRFQTTKGCFSTEDLWDLTLEHLNVVAIGLNRQVRKSQEEDFLKEASPTDETTMCKLELVLYIMDVKKEEKKARVKEAENKTRKDKLLGALERKEEDKLDGMSAADIKKELKKL
jgi:hypothetical protein